ncbi:MAG: hypothetical protein LBT47_13330 [Deltaproteobacteria bacterium]|jgi:tetratricopeptide (TPR) repeat protein|nr:hypothetical protein [Deltaproteobacteria bacterium]
MSLKKIMTSFFNMGHNEWEKNNHALALWAWQLNGDVNPGNPDGYLLIIKKLEEAGYLDSAIEFAKFAARKMDGNINLTREIAMLSEKRMNWNEAGRQWELLLGTSVAQAEDYQRTVICFLYLKDFQKANRYLMEALAIFPGNIRLVELLPAFFRAKGEKYNEIQAWRTVLGRFPNHMEACYNKIFDIYLGLNEIHCAGEVIEEALSELPTSSALILRRARLATVKKDWEAADIRWRENIEQSPKIFSYSGAVYSLIAQDRLDDAEALIGQIPMTTLQQAYVKDMADMKATIFTRRKQFSELEILWDQYRQQHPDDLHGYIQGLRHAINQNNQTKGEDLFKTIERSDFDVYGLPLFLDICFDLLLNDLKIKASFDICLSRLKYLLNEPVKGEDNFVPRFLFKIVREGWRSLASYKNIKVMVAKAIPELLKSQPVTPTMELTVLGLDGICDDLFDVKNLMINCFLEHNFYTKCYTFREEHENNKIRKMFLEYVKASMKDGLVGLSHQQIYMMALFVSALDHDLFLQFLTIVDNIFWYSLPDEREAVGLLRSIAGKIKKRVIATEIDHCTSQKKLTIALCVSGQLRGFKQAYPTWERLGLEQHNVDIFVHTWKNPGAQIPTLMHADRCFKGNFLNAYRLELGKADFSFFINKYPSLFDYFKRASDIDVDFIKKFYKTDWAKVEDENNEVFLNWNNQRKMFYKIQACYHMVEDSKKTYDLVFRIRPDMNFISANIDWHDIYDRSSAQSVIFANKKRLIGYSAFYGMGDQLALGTQENMAIYSNAYSNIDEARHGLLYGHVNNFTSHEPLAHTLFIAGIRDELLDNVKRGPLLNPKVLEPYEIRDLLLRDIGTRSCDPTDKALLDACEKDMGNQIRQPD